MKTTNTPISNPTLENRLTNDMDATGKKSELNATEMAKKQLPKLSENSMVFFWTEFFQAFQGCIDDISTTLQIPAQVYKLQGLDKLYKEEEQKLDNELHSYNERQIDIKKELRTLNHSVMNWAPFFIIMALLACIGDALYNQQIFEYAFGVDYTTSWIIAGISGVFIWGVTHFLLPPLLRPDNNRDSLYIRYAIVLAVSFAIFLVLGYMRSFHVATTNAEEGISVVVSPFFFAFVSWAIFLAALAFTMRAKKSSTGASNQDAIRSNELKEELRQSKKAVRRLYKEIQNLKEERVEERSQIMKQINYGYDLEQRVITEAKKVFHQYKKTNFRSRSDGKPICFDSNEFPFEFKTHCTAFENTRHQTASAVAVVAIGIVSFLVSCNTDVPPTPNDTTVVVLSDPTDIHLLSPDSATLWPFLNIKEHPWSSYRVEVGAISNIAYAPTTTVFLKAENRSQSSMGIRKKKIAKFKRDLFPLLYKHQCKGSTNELDQSVIYRTLIYHLKRLQDSKDAIRQLLVYSDLMEYSDVKDFYKKETMIRIRNNPDEFAQELEAIEPIGDLTGIEIYLLFQPRDFEESKRYVTVSNFYKRLFEQKGATVYIGSLTHF